MKISKHFNRSEFDCRCGCGLNTVDVRLVEILEQVRKHFGCPVIINSGCRCATHNRKIEGRANSKHLIGKAADIIVVKRIPREVFDYLKDYTCGLGLYSTFVHVDSRDYVFRW